jgi:hypothetical protein
MPRHYDEQYFRDETPPPYVPPGNKPPGREEGEGPSLPPPPINPPGLPPPNQQGVTGGYYQQYGQQDVLGTDLQSVLGDRYDVGALQKEYGDIFADYDPTREQFAQKGLAFGQEAAGIGYGRRLGQYERQSELLGSQLGEEGYLAQAMGRQMGQLGLSREAATSGAEFQTGALGRQREQLGLSRGAAEESAAFQTGELGRQRAGAQRGISQAYTGGRQGLLAMREQAAQTSGRGGFAGSGAAQTQSERARQAYMGQLGGDVSNLKDRLTGIGAREQMVQSGLERQMAGFGIQGRGIGAREQQIESDLSRQMRGFDIQGQGVQAGFGEATQRAQSQLTGIQSEIGEGGFLSQAYQNQLGQLGLGFQEDVYGLRDVYGEKQRDRLMDLISSGADLSRFRGSGGAPTTPGGTPTDRDVDSGWADPSREGTNTGDQYDEDQAEGGTGPEYDAWLAQQQRQGNTTQYGNQTQEGYTPPIVAPEKDIADYTRRSGRG